MAFSSLKSISISHLAFAALLIGGAANAKQASAQTSYTNIFACAVASSATTDREMAGRGINFNIAAGVRYTMPFTDRWHFALGATINNRGFKEQIDHNGQKAVATTVRTTNIDVPLLIIYKPYLSNSAYFGAGALTTFRLKASASLQGFPEAASPYGKAHLLDYGPTVLMGYELNDNISLELQGNYSLRGIFESDATLPLSQTPIRECSVTFGISYRF